MKPLRSTAALLAFTVSLWNGTSSVQADPVDVAPPSAPANPLNQQVPAHGEATAMVVPEFIQPGARLIYETVSTSEGQQRHTVFVDRYNDPLGVHTDERPGTTSSGYASFDVVAVTPTHVLVKTGIYMPAFNIPNSFSSVGGPGMVVNAMTVDAGAAMWMPISDLANRQSSDGVTIVHGPWEQDGQTYQATTIEIESRDSKTMYVFDQGTGLKLLEMTGTGQFRRGGGTNFGYNRQVQSSTTFKTFRQMELPWLNSAAPAWAQEVQSMAYQGTITMSTPGVPPMALPYRFTANFQQRGENWAMGTQEVEIQGQPGSTDPLIVGAGSIGNFWMNPQLLNTMAQGEIDRDPFFGSTLTYQIQDGPQGRLGVLIETGRSNVYVNVWGYSLQDGALVYVSSQNADMGVHTELTLTNRR